MANKNTPPPATKPRTCRATKAREGDEAGGGEGEPRPRRARSGPAKGPRHCAGWRWQSSSTASRSWPTYCKPPLSGEHKLSFTQANERANLRRGRNGQPGCVVAPRAATHPPSVRQQTHRVGMARRRRHFGTGVHGQRRSGRVSPRPEGATMASRPCAMQGCTPGVLCARQHRPWPAQAACPPPSPPRAFAGRLHAK